MALRDCGLRDVSRAKRSEHHMELGLKGRAALVCGASTGIGRAAAEALAREGANVALIARGADALNRAESEIRERHGVEAVGIPCDLADAEAIGPLVATVRRAIGAIDILVTNAGGPPSGPLATTSDAAWDRARELTLMSVVRLCRETIPEMRERRWGRIVHLTSISVKQPIPGLGLSNALRAAVAGLSKTLAEENGPFGITVNCIAPGYTATERLSELASEMAAARGSTEEAVRAGWIATIPTGRLAAPGEIGDLVAFLASERAASITGSVIAVDGGSTKGLL